MVFHCVRQNAPAAFNCPDLTFFDKLVVRLLRLMHISQKIISAKLPLWPARGTWQAPPCIALSNRIFPGQCKLWQIPSSCIMRFPANLPNSRESGRVSLFQLRGMLSDWMMLKLQPSTPVLSPLPSCDHLVSSVFSHFFPHFFEATSVGLAGNWSTNLTWAQKNYVNAKAPWHKHRSVTVSSGEVKCVCATVSAWVQNEG